MVGLSQVQAGYFGRAESISGSGSIKVRGR